MPPCITLLVYSRAMRRCLTKNDVVAIRPIHAHPPSEQAASEAIHSPAHELGEKWVGKQAVFRQRKGFTFQESRDRPWPDKTRRDHQNATAAGPFRRECRTDRRNGLLTLGGPVLEQAHGMPGGKRW